MQTKYQNEVSKCIYRTWNDQREAAQFFGIKQSSLAKWIKLGIVPISKLPDFVQATKGKPEKLNPMYKSIASIVA